MKATAFVGWVAALACVAATPAGPGRASGADVPAAGSLELPQRLAAAGISGGLVVHVGFSRPALPIGVVEDRRFTLHALNRDAGRVDDARTWLQQKGIVERAIVECVTGPKLPHADCLARAMVVEDGSGFDPAELDRVLSPHGLLLRRQGDKWQGTIKPMPPEMDDWPHVDHDAGRTRVSMDRTLAAPTNLRWLTRTRFRVRLPVVAGGRVFYTFKFEPPYALAAYCAFTGTVLWTDSYECDEWPQPMIATDKLLYLPGKAVAADTGQPRLTYTGCPRALADDLLIVSSTTDGKRQFSAIRPDGGKAVWTHPAVDGIGIGPKRFVLASAEGQVLRAYEIATGRELWTRDVGKSAKQVGVEDLGEQWAKGQCGLMATETHMTVICTALEGLPGKRKPAAKKYVLLFSADDGSFLRAVSFLPSDGWDDGKANRRPESILTLSGANLWCWIDPHEDVQTCAAGRSEWQSLGTKLPPKPGGPLANRWRLGLVGMGIADGKCIQAARTEVQSPADLTLHCFSGPVWSPRYAFRGKLNTICLADASIESAIWAGGGCSLANVPAYGLHFVGPNWTHSAGGLIGLVALDCRTGSGKASAEALGREHLQKGPAYDDAPAAKDLRPRVARAYAPDEAAPSSAEWEKAWEVEIARDRVKVQRGLLPESTAWLIPPPFGRPRADEHHSFTGYCTAPPPALCGELLLVSVPQERRLLAFDVDDGRLRWELAGGARFGSPTWCGELCLVGNWDGWVYAIRMADGKLAWRNLVGCEERRIMWEEKPVSAWPVAGSPLAEGGRVYAVAGLHNLVADGGVTLACFDLPTGKTIWKQRVPAVAPQQPDQAGQPPLPGGVVSVSGLGASPHVLAGGAIGLGPWRFARDTGRLLTPQEYAAAAATQPGANAALRLIRLREQTLRAGTAADTPLRLAATSPSRLACYRPLSPAAAVEPMSAPAPKARPAPKPIPAPAGRVPAPARAAAKGPSLGTLLAIGLFLLAAAIVVLARVRRRAAR